MRDDWGEPTASRCELTVDPTARTSPGVTNLDVATSSAAAVSGIPVGSLREVDKQIPIVGAPALEERAAARRHRRTSTSTRCSGTQRVPLGQVSHLRTEMTTEKIKRRNQFRTITVSAFPVPGVLPSEVMRRRDADDRRRSAASCRPATASRSAARTRSRSKGFSELRGRHGGLRGAHLPRARPPVQERGEAAPRLRGDPLRRRPARWRPAIMGQPFGFMAFLGVISLVGVIVSHVIVLFDFIEESARAAASRCARRCSTRASCGCGP